MAILKPEANVPLEIALQRRDGMEVKSSYGYTQTLYTVLCDGAKYKLYSMPEMTEQINQLRLGVGERFTICKRQRNGSKAVEWQVARVDPAAAAPRAAAAAPAAVAQQPPSSAFTIKSPPALAQMPRPSVAEEIASGIHPAAQGVLSALMSLCITAAIDAWRIGQEYAASKGHVLQVNTENIQGSASTMFIQLSRDGQVMLPRITGTQGGAKWSN